MYQKPVDKLEKVQLRAHWNDAEFGNLPQNKDLGNSIYLEKTEKDHHHRSCLLTEEEDFSNSGREKTDKTQ